MKKLLFAVLLLPVLVHAQVYKCQGANGMTYSQTPCDKTAKSSTTLPISTTPAPEGTYSSTPYRDMDRRLEVDREKEQAVIRQNQARYQARESAKLDAELLDLERRKVAAAEKAAKAARKPVVCTGSSYRVTPELSSTTTVCR